MKDPPPQLPSVDDKTTGKKKSVAKNYRQAGIINTQKNDYAARVAAAAAQARGEMPRPTERMTGENYTRLYLQRREAELAAQRDKGKK